MKTILHLCADIGSDTYPYQIDPAYRVILVGKDIGVENYIPPDGVHGVIANPVCTEFSVVKGFHKLIDKPCTSILDHCQRIIKEANPKWWAIENPASGTMNKVLGRPDYEYEPWMFGSPWTKRTALWGSFKPPMPKYTRRGEVGRNPKLWVRSGRQMATIVYQHKSAIHHIPEFEPFIDKVKNDNAFRSLCSQGFAKAFKEVNP